MLALDGRTSRVNGAAQDRLGTREAGNQASRLRGRRHALPLLLWDALPFLALAFMLCLSTASARAADSGKNEDSPTVDLGPEIPRALPAIATGDILYTLDASTFPGRDSLPRVEFYLRVARELLNFRPLGEVWRDSVTVELTLADLEGHELRRWTHVLRPTVADQREAKEPAGRELMAFRADVEPGTYVLQSVLTDELAPKKTILGMIRKEHMNGRAVGLLTVRSMPRDSLALSDLEFAESIAPADTGQWRKHELMVRPNPGRRYGRDGSQLQLYLEGTLPQGRADSRLHLVWEVLDPRGKRRQMISDSLLATPGFHLARSLDMSQLPAGSYRLRLTANAEDGLTAVTEGRFEMGWRAGAQERNVEALEDQARLVLLGQELDDFLDMSTGDRERYWEEYWEKLRALPENLDNDPMTEFQHRLASANANFGGRQKGYDTDRGRVLVQYGPPDEVTQRDIPVSGETLTDLSTQIALEPEMATVLQQHGQGGRGDVRAWIMWDYDLRGRQVFGTRNRQARHGNRMRFVFVDDTGTGDYRLLYSSER